ncbi:two-component system histidine kinase PnpS [Thalassorhabdus alkalitolerans]|uniref:histidine kinase n=1 Tax=Thalassorhabdus alkalitolerans TaxID=2282697 RepID=A0ABW0YN81_9BACI
MKKLRTRLMIGFLSVIFLVLVILGFLVGEVVKSSYLDQLTDRLEREAELAALTISERGGDEWQSLAVDISESLGTRVTILNSEGTVIGESERTPVGMENHSGRPEIMNAGESGTHHVRYSTTVGAELLYFALPLELNGEVEGYLRLGLPVEHVNEMNRQIWIFIGLTFTVAFFVILSLNYRIASQLTKPIGQVTKVANELAKGNFNARTYSGSKDEVGQLTRSINVLAYNLGQITKRYQTQQERLEALIDNMGSGLIFINDRGDITLINQACKDIFNENTDEWQDVLYYEVIHEKELIKFIQSVLLTEQKDRQQVTISAPLEMKYYDVYGAPVIGARNKLRGIVLVLHDISELKKLEQVRKDFVANVSHELRTPVTSVKGFAETLLDGAMENPELRKQFLDIIWKESDRLQDLISELLELSKIEQEHFQLHIQQVNIAALTKEVTDLLLPKAKEKDITVTSKGDGKALMNGDPARLKQILINIINNSIVYTPVKGNILVEVTSEDKQIKVSVTDTGIGISQEHIKRIFERFYRIEKARSRNSGGTGLGLAIVKHLVEAHQGKIEVDSTLGKGTTFTLTFPKELI